MRTILPTTDITVRPGAVTVIEIEVANTSSVIDGITAVVEGVDPSWVELPVPILSLFPDSTGILPIRITFPPSTVVGSYLLVVRIESTIDPSRTSTHDLWVQVEPIEAATLRLRPSVVTGGRAARFGAYVANDGNVTTDYRIGAIDETRALDCRTDPVTLTVVPATEGLATIDVRGRRPWFGQTVTRTVLVTAVANEIELRALATFNQKPRIPRGALTLAILAAIVALWATIFLVGVDALRDRSRPTKAVPAHFASGGVQDVPAASVAGSLAGKVTARSTGEGLARTTVEAFRLKPDGTVEVSGSAATAEDGTYTLTGLLPGVYKLRFTSEGFAERWYPAATTEAGAEEVRVDPQEAVTGVDLTMPGQPGSLIAALALPASADPSQPVTVTITQLPAGDAAPAGDGPAPPAPPPIVREVVGGQLAVDGLTTPATYRIRVEAAGFAPYEFEQELTGGETSVLNTVRLGAGQGSISGIVRSSTGEPLGNVEVVATSGEIEVAATTPTAGDVGAFVLEGLETPQTYVLTFTREGFSSQTLALDLGPGEAQPGVTATLTSGSGTILGQATDAAGTPLGGVEVTVTGGTFSAGTVTLTTSGPAAPVGSYRVSDVPAPGAYTVTFSRDGFVDQVVRVDFSDPGTQPDVSAVMQPATASVRGVITGIGGRLVGATVTLSFGDPSRLRTTTTTTTPAGGYSFADVPPGAYTLTVAHPDHDTRIVLLDVAAGDAVVRDIGLPAAT